MVQLNLEPDGLHCLVEYICIITFCIVLERCGCPILLILESLHKDLCLMDD